MKDWHRALVYKDTEIIEALKIIDEQALQIALVVDPDRRLIGTVTDGDIRRGLLKGVSLSGKVGEVMHTEPIVVKQEQATDFVLELMKQKHIYQVPIVDKNRVLVGLQLLDELLQPKQRDNSVVLMAGGLGKRLGSLTQDCPKPLLTVGNKPILETIIESFAECGYRNFYLSVNYKAKMIQDYFQDGSKLGVNISYLCENKRMGTAGSLSLLQKKPQSPLIIMNGDILTKINYNQLIEFHESHKAAATLCVRDYSVHVPYGVVQMENNRLINIIEKPKQSFFVSAGIYVLDPDALDFIPYNEYLDMPDLLKKMIDNNKNIMAFPVREYWLDIGSKVDYDKANGDYGTIF